MDAWSLFADVLDYPTDAVAGQAEVLSGVLAQTGGYDDACELLDRFRDSCNQFGIGRLQEIYTACFDMRADGSLYAGYHLFGDQWPRSSFLARLRKSYREHGFEPGADLPDHIGVILRFVAVDDDAEEREDLLCHCLVPSIGRILEKTAESNPYRLVLCALLAFLQKTVKPDQKEAAT